MKKVLPLFVILFVSALLCAQTIHPNYQDGKIWFKLKDNYYLPLNISEDPQNIEIPTLPFMQDIAGICRVEKLSKPFASAKKSFALQRTFLLRFSDHNRVDHIIKMLSAMPMVEYAEKVPLDRIEYTPNDPSYSAMWHLTKINAAGAWNYFNAVSTRTVAIVDNAVQTNHTDLTANIWINPGETPSNSVDDDGNGYVDDINGYDVADNDNNPNPPNNSFDHGTHCAGDAAATTDNGIVLAAIGFRIKIIAVKATANAASPSSITDGYDGIIYAADAGANVISCSWGSSTFSSTGQNVVNYAWSQGCIIVAAAGNSNVNTLYYPAAYANVMAVASTGTTDVKSSFSNYGTWIDVCAPGENIYSSVPTNAYAYMSGTSMACPIVAGLAGLMKAFVPGATSTDIVNCIKNTAVNINALNPSYVGQLGTGRIDANAAMGCIGAFLNNAPVVDFIANNTTVPAGSQITFTDLSLYNPTTWAWTFNGGTPGTSNAQVPGPITFSTPGVYTIVLTCTNPNGTDTETKVNYITVTSAVSCDTLFLPVPPTWSLVNYFTGVNGANGWVNGCNNLDDKEKAAYFDASAFPYTYLTGWFIGFGKAWSAVPADVVPVKVYDGTTGTPGTLLATTNLTMGQIMADVQNFYYTDFIFQTPVLLPASKRFFISVDVDALTWNSNPKDTLSIVSNTGGQTVPAAVWDKKNNNAWIQYTQPLTWNIAISLLIHPILTNYPTVATFTQDATTICQGGSINYNATGSTYEDTLLWIFQGGTPATSNQVQPSVIYNTAGTFTAKLYVIGGACGHLDSMVTTITVNPAPTLSITANPGTNICLSTSTTLTATGATSYVWSPATALSATTGAVVVANPTSTTSYNLTGTGANGCTSNAAITINVIPPPVASVTTTSTNICINQTVTFDASGSQNVTAYSWNFPGGNPATSTAALQTVTYPGAGSFTATLTATNSCGTDNSYSQMVTVGCVGLEEFYNGDGYHSLYQSQNDMLHLFNGVASNNNIRISLYSMLGQQVLHGQMNGAEKTMSIDLSHLPPGVYIVAMDGGDRFYRAKFVVE